MSQIQLHAVQTRVPRQRLVPERIGIKVFCTPALKKLGWKHTQQHSTEASKLELWLTDVHCPTAVVEATVRSRLQKDREPRHSSAETEWNMRSHLKPRGPQLLQPRALPSACEETSSQLKMDVGGGVRWWGGVLGTMTNMNFIIFIICLCGDAFLICNS